jgi:hypothetical protein
MADKNHKSLWLGQEGVKELNKARVNMLNSHPSFKHSDKNVVTHALKFYNLYNHLDK